MTLLNSKDNERLTNSKTLWISTVSRNLSPHMVPVWHVIDNSKIYICTGEHSIKLNNIKSNPKIAFALEDGNNPLCGNGKATYREPNLDHDFNVINKFKEKYDWDILNDKDYTMLIEIEISKILMRNN